MTNTQRQEVVPKIVTEKAGVVHECPHDQEDTQDLETTGDRHGHRVISPVQSQEDQDTPILVPIPKNHDPIPAHGVAIAPLLLAIHVITAILVPSPVLVRDPKGKDTLHLLAVRESPI